MFMHSLLLYCLYLFASICISHYQTGYDWRVVTLVFKDRYEYRLP
ncbi:hypothetical protein GMES_2033 [Paraglaciecola mesophila KMM 241]|uniref:Uncharacterized protein n=1 Tax=Paraglaciecola mesophila KMM 241 TaxID=1128912 RepID=K6XUQ5_9ALTE|nr:hypothetical protein GMES_2033 [Paraglaciecola mesophila KMM 241]